MAVQRREEGARLPEESAQDCQPVHGPRCSSEFSRVLGVPYISANIYCKSRNLPNTDIHNYSKDLRQFLRNSVVYIYFFLKNSPS